MAELWIDKQYSTINLFIGNNARQHNEMGCNKVMRWADRMMSMMTNDEEST